MRVLHVTEALAGGVLSSLETLTREQAARDDMTISVLYTAREDTPDAATLRHIFHPRVRLHNVARPSRLRGLQALARTARRLAAGKDDCVVHLHSSFAGGVGRLPMLGPRRRSGAALLYSPHGYAFLRRDISPIAREAYRLAERTLARRGTSVLVSTSEATLAQEAIGARVTAVLTNAVDGEELESIRPLRPRALGSERPTVAMAGRVTYQKAPWRFARLAREFAGEADFVWIGGGDRRAVGEWLSDSPVSVTGWLPRRDALTTLAATDVFCFPTLWEGLPMTLIEAQALAVPAIASKIVGNVDCISPGITGFLAESYEEMASQLKTLLRDSEMRNLMGNAARERALTAFSSKRLGWESARIYADALATSHQPRFARSRIFHHQP